MERQFRAIGSTVRFYRARVGLSQTVVAKAMGYKNGQYISNVERGMCRVPVKSIPRLAKILNIGNETLIDSWLADERVYMERICREDQGGNNDTN